MGILNSVCKNSGFSIHKRYLLFVAGALWLTGGGMLLFRGSDFISRVSRFRAVEIICCLLAGILFYRVVFRKLSLRHITRILGLEPEYVSPFSFFDLKSYIMMAIMISFGVALRLSGIIPLHFLSLFYIIMGTPLFISALRFVYYGINYENQMKLPAS